MLQSSDKETVILGMIACLEQGEEWCRKNIPFDGGRRDSEMKHNLENGRFFGVRRGNLVIYVGARYLHCRENSQFEFPPSIAFTLDL